MPGSAPKRRRRSMLKRNLLAASLLAFAVTTMPALAQDVSKYPDWSGQWKRPPGAGIQWDQTRRPGLDQNPPLTPEYKAIFEASLADQAKGAQGENLRVTVTTNAFTRPWTITKKYIREQGKVIWNEDECGENNNHVVIGKENYFLSADGLLMPTKKNQAPPDLRYFSQTGN